MLLSKHHGILRLTLIQAAQNPSVRNPPPPPRPAERPHGPCFSPAQNRQHSGRTQCQSMRHVRGDETRLDSACIPWIWVVAEKPQNNGWGQVCGLSLTARCYTPAARSQRIDTAPERCAQGEEITVTLNVYGKNKTKQTNPNINRTRYDLHGYIKCLLNWCSENKNWLFSDH